MDTFTIQSTHTDLVTEECYKCGVLFAMPQALKNSCLKHTIGSTLETFHFYCPNGHRQAYTGQNREEQLRAEVERERERRYAEEARREGAEASARAHKGAATKARKRAKAGTCPCCKRTFKQLSTHMRKQHPDFDPEAVKA